MDRIIYSKVLPFYSFSHIFQVFDILVQWNCLLCFNRVDKRFLYSLCLILGFLFFLLGSFNLINFDRWWFLMGIDFCETSYPGLIFKLKFVFGDFLWICISFRQKQSVKLFKKSFMWYISVYARCMVVTLYPSQAKNNQAQYFLD